MIKLRIINLWILVFILFVLAVSLGGFRFEFPAVLIMGILIANFKPKERKSNLKIMLFIIVLAMFFDPILKPYLDKLLNINTVPTLFYSMIFNGTLLIGFLGSYYLTLKLIKEKKLRLYE